MIWPILILLHVALGLAATLHVLFNKSNIRASIGWIGVIWLSPFIGAILYSAFGINRVARKASKLKQSKLFSDKSADFSVIKVPIQNDLARQISNMGNQISDYPVVGGNKVKILKDGDEAYPAMLDAIQKAQHSIALSMYIFKVDYAGQQFVDALSLAKDRGVEIRVLVDGFGSGYFFSPAIRQLKARGIEACRFMHGWSPWHLSFINMRNHKKIMIVDGMISFVGGLNLSSKNIFLKRHKRENNDTQFCFKGPIVAQLTTSFAEDWHFTTGELLIDKIWWPEVKSHGHVSLRAINSGPDEDIGKLETILAVAINAAKHHIKIITPYFLPDERLYFLLKLAALRGVQIDLVIPAKSDSYLVDHAVNGYLASMNFDLINCYHSHDEFDHSKLVTIDGSWCALGSPNWDVRSMRLNFEVLVESYDNDMVAKIDTLIDQKIAAAKQYTSIELSQRGYISKLLDACARLLLPYL